MKRLFAVSLALLMVVALGTVSHAYGGRGGPGGGMGYGGGYYGAGLLNQPGLNLTAEQASKIRTMDAQFLRENKPLQDKLYSKRGDLKLLWMERNPDQQKINAAQSEMRALRDQAQDKATAHRLAVLNILTPEQREQVQSYGPGRGMPRRAAGR
jgi:Spy/CpxP family protein refolding chaperone